MLGSHVKVAVIVLIVAVVVVEGYLVYRFYEVTSSDDAAAGAASVAETMSEPTDLRDGEGTMPGEVDPPDRTAGSEEDPTEVDGAATFVHRAASENTNANSTYLDHPSANGNPDAFVLITPVWEPGGSKTNNNAHSVGVWYNGERERWAVYNQDLSPMPQGAVFNVSVSKRSGGALFVHRATAGGAPDNISYLDHPLTNGKPEAVLQVTPKWNPGGRGAVYDNHTVGAFYDSEKGKWAVFNQDDAPMPNGAAFNVAVSGVSVPAA